MFVAQRSGLCIRCAGGFGRLMRGFQGLFGFGLGGGGFGQGGIGAGAGGLGLFLLGLGFFQGGSCILHRAFQTSRVPLRRGGLGEAHPDNQHQVAGGQRDGHRMHGHAGKVEAQVTGKEQELRRDNHHRSMMQCNQTRSRKQGGAAGIGGDRRQRDEEDHMHVGLHRVAA